MQREDVSLKLFGAFLIIKKKVSILGAESLLLLREASCSWRQKGMSHWCGAALLQQCFPISFDEERPRAYKFLDSG